ncbi:MAG: tetratricopeptide repeat protein [Gemmatimonadota bacterium]
MAPIPSDAKEELETLERKHAENPEGRYFVPLANVYRRKGELGRAMSLLREGLAKHPDYLSAHIVLGRCLADQGEAGAAEAEFRHVLSLDPQNLIALRTLGEISIAQGNANEARKWYRELLVVDPMNEDARRALETLQGGETAGEATERAADIPSVQDPLPDGAALDAGTAEVAPTAAGEAADYDTLFGTMIDFEAAGEKGPTDGLDVDGDAVVTETIAELYTRQGFYDRAADIYRELIRRRGGDATLEERLRQVQAMSAAGEAVDEVDELHTAASTEAPVPVRAEDRADQEPASAPVAAPPAETSLDAADFVTGPDAGEAAEGMEVDVDDLFADSFSGGFPAEDAAGDDSPASAPVAPVAHSAAAPGDEETIGEYLASVFSWAPPSGFEAPSTEPTEPAESARPAETAGPQETDGVPDETADTVGVESLAGLEAGFYGVSEQSEAEPETATESASTEDDWFVSTSLEVADEEPGETGDAIVEEPVSPAAEDPEELPVMAPALSDEDLFPWELPPSAEPRAEEGESAQAAAAEPEWPESRPEAFEDEPFGRTDQPDMAESTADPAGAPEPEDESASPPAPESASETDATRSAEEDDDLESFQAWLRSLKR